MPLPIFNGGRLYIFLLEIIQEICDKRIWSSHEISRETYANDDFLFSIENHVWAKCMATSGRQVNSWKNAKFRQFRLECFVKKELIYLRLV